ncbi:MAG: 2-amino-4-hydroxy-6-hydroxymethyldihydropteridine diphosphokinase [Aminivibrio sp.]|jgi:2-amino-4-hydroxy-6-hydroxymethyldihydropteridine diphosphokinase|nr:2-amino-4-hydroxy-6-hydroxymethyldihydropteridine diphosphokinase [Synergistaceae bacterium]
MSLVAISLGSNLGDRLQLLRKAVCALKERDFSILASSDVFETPPWGVKDQPRFLNACVLAETRLSPEEALAAVKEIEKALGRTRTWRWGPRLIDLDIIFYDDLVMETPDLTVPHPEMARRAFVLLPLTQAAPYWRHPVTGFTAEEMARALPEEETDGLVQISPL